MKGCKKAKGFTLVELMACIAILGILTTALGFFFDGMLKLYANENARTTIQFDARRALTSITGDVRNALSVDEVKDDSLTFTNRKNDKMKYFCSTNILKRSNENLVENIEQVKFAEPNPNILYVSITARMKNIEYSISSSVKLPKDLSIKPQINNMDLSFLEKNVINIINPGFNFNLQNVTINTNAHNGDNEKDNLFFECNTFDCSGLGSAGSNLNNGDLVVKANIMNWGDKCLAMGKNNNQSNTIILDVPRFEGTLDTNIVQSINYANYKYQLPNGLDFSKCNNNSNYPETGRWSKVFDTNDKSSIENMTISKLKEDTDFSGSNISNSIHYFSKANNKIVISSSVSNPLNDYRGIPNRNSINNDSYEYIICHGPLNISSDTDNVNFKFRGLIYCDDVVTFDNITPAFKGILISKGINVITKQHQNWIDINFDSNDSKNGGLDEINRLLIKNTEGNN